MAVSQVIATLQVYLSNLRLNTMVGVVSAAGYTAVPNQIVAGGLKDLGPAFWGGLFFTLSIGSGISLLSIATAWIWERYFQRNKFLLLSFLWLWAAPVLLVNVHGFNLLVSSYFVIIPPVVFTATLRWMPASIKQISIRRVLIHLAPIFLLAFLWVHQYDRYLFTDLRDHLLLSNPIGKRINTFYYTYTLYPAEVFKSLNQKTIKTARISNIADGSTRALIQSKLALHDYLVLDGDLSADLVITQEGAHLVLKDKNQVLLQPTVAEFSAHPSTTLTSFADKHDRFAVFRHLTFISLLIGFPTALYLLLQGIMNVFLALRWGPATSGLIASLICAIIGVGVFLYFYQGRSHVDQINDPQEALTSARWQERVAALKKIQEDGGDIARYPAYKNLLQSKHTPERYWLVRAFSTSRDKGIYPALIEYIDDPDLNVRTMAYYALGKRNERPAVNEILKRIKTSGQWYDQMYAYRALRTLGWTQKKLK